MRKTATAGVTSDLNLALLLASACKSSPYHEHALAYCRKIEQRQVGERCRVAGNALFQTGRWAEAYQEYDRGLSADKHNMALHANAALCSLNMACNVQAIEHADKVLSACIDSEEDNGMASQTSSTCFENGNLTSKGNLDLLPVRLIKDKI